MLSKTQRLLLKPILESDLNALHSIFIDPYVKKYLCDDKIFSLQQVEEIAKAKMEDLNANNLDTAVKIIS